MFSCILDILAILQALVTLRVISTSPARIRSPSLAGSSKAPYWGSYPQNIFCIVFVFVCVFVYHHHQLCLTQARIRSPNLAGASKAPYWGSCPQNTHVLIIHTCPCPSMKTITISLRKIAIFFTITASPEGGTTQCNNYDMTGGCIHVPLQACS